MRFTAPRGVLRLFTHLDLGDGQGAIDVFGLKFYFVAHLDLVEHCRIIDPENHGHYRHVEVADKAMLDREFAGILVEAVARINAMIF